jgi:hypothetical protein
VRGSRPRMDVTGPMFPQNDRQVDPIAPRLATEAGIAVRNEPTSARGFAPTDRTHGPGAERTQAEGSWSEGGARDRGAERTEDQAAAPNEPKSGQDGVSLLPTPRFETNPPCPIIGAKRSHFDSHPARNEPKPAQTGATLRTTPPGAKRTEERGSGAREEGTPRRETNRRRPGAGAKTNPITGRPRPRRQAVGRRAKRTHGEPSPRTKRTQSRPHGVAETKPKLREMGKLCRHPPSTRNEPKNAGSHGL